MRVADAHGVAGGQRVADGVARHRAGATIALGQRQLRSANDLDPGHGARIDATTSQLLVAAGAVTQVDGVDADARRAVRIADEEQALGVGVKRDQAAAGGDGIAVVQWVEIEGQVTAIGVDVAQGALDMVAVEMDDGP